MLFFSYLKCSTQFTYHHLLVHYMQVFWCLNITPMWLSDTMGINVPLEKLPMVFLLESEPDCYHSDIRALVRSNTDVGQQGLAHGLYSSSSQMHWVGLGSGLCAGPTMTLWSWLFVWGFCHVETGKGHPWVIPQSLTIPLSKILCMSKH